MSVVLRVIGPTALDGVERMTPRALQVLAALAVDPSRAVPVEAVIDEIWATATPRTARQVVHNAVSVVRRRYGAEAIESEPSSAYRLGCTWVTDETQLLRALDEAKAYGASGHVDLELQRRRSASSLVRGELFHDLQESDRIAARRAGFRQICLTMDEDLVFALLAAGEPAGAAAEAAALAGLEPYREIRWSLLALALYRCNDRRASLEAMQRGRRGLRHDLGLDPGPVMVRLESMVLHDDPRLHDPSPRLALGVAASEKTRVATVTPPIADVADPRERLALLERQASALTATGRHAEAGLALAAAVEVSATIDGEDSPATMALRLRHAERLRRANDPLYVDTVWGIVERAERVGDTVSYALGAAALCKLSHTTKSGLLDDRVTGAVERALATCTDIAARARVAGEATTYFSMGGEPDRCRALFDEALALARQVDDDALLFAALGNAYLALPHPADQALRTQVASDMVMIAERLDDDDARLEALHTMFSVQLQTNDPLLRTTLARQDALARSVGSAARCWMADYQLASLALIEGRLDESAALLRHSFERAPVDVSRAWGTVLVGMVFVRSAQGRSEEVRADVEAVVDAAPMIPGWRAILAWLASQRGDHTEALRLCDGLDLGRGLAVDVSWSGAMIVLGRTIATCGDAPRIATMYEALAPYSGLVSWVSSTTAGPFDLPLAELALAAGDLDAARRHLDGVRHTIDRLGAELYRPDLDRLTADIAAR
jgi:DNA-binding SARP family transcriptional activator